MANTKQLTAMLKQMGWGSGFRLPISNDENTKLEQLLEMKQSRLVSLSLELQEVSSAISNNESFMKNLNSKLRHSKDVEAAKRSQMEKEKQFLALAERDHAKTEQDMKRMQKRLKAVKERNRKLEENMLRRKDALGELVDVINFDKKAIAAYEEKFSKEDAYMKLIEDFADTDNEKLRKCRDEYQQLGEKVADSRAYLDKTVLETEIMEGELDEVAKRFRKAHAERNQTIENWKRTLEVLEDRDKEIMDTKNEYQEVSLEMKKKIDLLEKQENFHETIKIQSKCYIGELNQIERNMNNLQKRKRESESQITDNSDYVGDLVRCIIIADKEIKDLQTKLKEISSDENNSDWKDKLEDLQEEVASLKAKYDVVMMEQLTSNEQAKQLQEFFEKEQKKVESLTRELSKQTALKSQREKQAKEISQDVMVKDSEVKNLKAAINQTRKKCVKTGDFLCKIRAAAYREVVKAMSLEGKLRELENPAATHDKEAYEKSQQQIARLKEILEEQFKTQSLVKAQISHCDHVAFTCQKELGKEEEQNHRYEYALHKLQTEIKRIGVEDEELLENIKDIGVENSLLHVQLRRMLQSIKMYESKMFDLEQQRMTMQMAVKERKKDIEVYSSLLLNKKRALQDELQKLRIKCHEVSNDVQSRKRKYEMIMEQMWAATNDEPSVSENSEGDSRSEAYYIIKMAQERERYRQEGDKWDERVKEAEKVVEGLQNTLSLMIGTNEAFKESLKPATENTDEGQKLKALKEKELEAVRNLKTMKDKREKYSRLLRQKQFQLDEFAARKADYEHQLMEKQFELQGVIIEINGQKEKIQRATQQANKLVRELSKLETLDAELLQNDLRLRVTKEKYEYAVLTLEKLLHTNPNMISEAVEFLHVKGLEKLASRLTRKMISASLASSPYQSGRSTPHSSRSTVAIRRTATGMISAGFSKDIINLRSTQKSVVFETLTSTASTTKMLENINKGLEAYRKSKIGITEKLAPPKQPYRKTPFIGEIKTEEKEGVSFGDLRKALKEAVEEHGKTGKTERESEDAARESIMSESQSRVAVLVDNREKFEETGPEDDQTKHEEI